MIDLIFIIHFKQKYQCPHAHYVTIISLSVLINLDYKRITTAKLKSV